jgi:hypothetical protein
LKDVLHNGVVIHHTSLSTIRGQGGERTNVASLEPRQWT